MNAPSSLWRELGRTPVAFRSVMGMFPTGVALLSAGSPERTKVLTVNSVVSVSLAPLLMLVSLGRGTPVLHEIAERERAFALNFLAEDQRALAASFASAGRNHGVAALRELGAHHTPAGSVLVAGALAALACELEAVHPGGDHQLLVGRVTSVYTGHSTKEPLVFHRGRYVGVGATALL